MNARTDAHALKNLITEDYEFVDCGDFGSGDEPGYDPFGPYGKAGYLFDEGWRLADQSGRQCQRCGVRLRYYAILKHNPSQTLIRVGVTCLENRFSRATHEFQRLRKQAKLDRERIKLERVRRCWFATDPDREVAYLYAQAQGGDFYANFVSKVQIYGSTTDKFVRAIMRSMVRDERRTQERAAEQALATPVVEGRGVIFGEVLATRYQDSVYGTTFKMLVRDDRGFKLWGTVPSKIDEVQKGDRVGLVATAERSKDDETFGFFKRPTKAAILPEGAD